MWQAVNSKFGVGKFAFFAQQHFVSICVSLSKMVRRTKVQLDNGKTKISIKIVIGCELINNSNCLLKRKDKTVIK